MADWVEFQKGMRGMSDSLGAYASEQQAKKDAIQMILMKAQIEQAVKQADPYQQAITKMMDNFSQGMGGSSSVMAPDTSSQEGSKSSGVVGIDRSQYFLKPSFGPSGPSFSFEQTPEAQLRNKLTEQKATQDLKSQVSPAKQQQDLQKAQSAYQNLQYMKQKAQGLPSGYGALKSNFGNFFSRGETNPQLALYEKQMPALSVAIYRDITGDTRLSDSDAQSRAYPLLWNPSRGEGKSIKQGVFEDLDKMYQARLRLIQKGQYKPNPLNPDEMITPIEDILNEAQLGRSGISGKSVVKTGTYNGKQVIQYSDGSVEYAQ